jgi:uncharacterized membrane protein
MRKYLIAGLLVWMPLGVTFLVVRAIVGFLDKSLLLLPDAFQPDRLLGFHIPGLGVLLAVALVLITGMIMANLLGRRLVAFWESLLARIPLVRTLYLAFMTSDDLGEVQDKTIANVISVFIPTTPNPTSGFVLMVPESDVIELDMAVEEGLKMIISMGVVVPNSLAYQKKRQDQQLTE